jgi:hypothetical protein
MDSWPSHVHERGFFFEEEAIRAGSMQSFVAGLEKGETKHLFPVNPAKVRTGEIALKDVPYMQRGGSWTNSDLTQKKKGWMNTGADSASVSDVF